MIRAAVTVSPESKLWSPSVAKRAAPPMATIAASQMSSGCARASSHSRRKRTRRSSAAGMYPRRIRTSARRPPQRLSDDAVAQVRHLARARYLDRLEPRRRPRLAQQAHAIAEENGQDEDQDLVEEPLARDRPSPAPAERLCRLRPLRAASGLVAAPAAEDRAGGRDRLIDEPRRHVARMLADPLHLVVRPRDEAVEDMVVCATTLAIVRDQITPVR